jgi:hypothetical protein
VCVALAGAVVGLAFAAPALAKPGSELEVFQDETGLGRVGAINVALHVASDSPPASEFVIYAPLGYRLKTASSAGTVVGTTSVTMYRGSHELFGKGLIVAADPRRYENSSCAPGPHDAVWLVRVIVQKQWIETPVFIQQGSSDGPVRASYTLRGCFPPPSAIGGLRFVWLDLFGGPFTNPTTPSEYDWTALVTTSGEPTHQFEVQTVVSIPQLLTFSARYDAKRGGAIISGTLTSAGAPRPRAGVYVSFSATRKSAERGRMLGGAVTDGNGRFTIPAPLRKTAWVDVFVSLARTEPCVSLTGAPCVFKTISSPPEVLRKVVVRSRP